MEDAELLVWNSEVSPRVSLDTFRNIREVFSALEPAEGSSPAAALVLDFRPSEL
jgi:hypothetical protein